MAYAGKKALVKAGGVPVAMTDEATTLLAGAGITVNTQYQITNATKRIIDINAAITVKVGGVVTTTGFYVDTLAGTVIFTAAAVRTVTVSGNYVPVAVAAECYEWSQTINQDLQDTSKFQDDWVSKTPTLKSAEGSLSRWYSIDPYFTAALTSGKPVVIEMYANDALQPDRMWAVLSSVEMASAVDGVVEESVSFESTSKMLMSYV